MDYLQSLIMGLVQGLTEFLPVSSTAHLILTPSIFGWKLTPEFTQARFAFDILVQWGTLVAVLVYFWRDLWNIGCAVATGLIKRDPFGTTDARLGWLTVVATIPAVVAGVGLNHEIERLHARPFVIVGVLIVFSGMIYAIERLGRRNRSLDQLNWRDALVIGLGQALAIVPGVSRSGATICGGLLVGLDRTAAARFSFIVSIPALTGAGILAIHELGKSQHLAAILPSMLLGTAAAAIVGFACIHWLLGYLARHSMDIFVWYRVLAGLAFLAILYFRG